MARFYTDYSYVADGYPWHELFRVCDSEKSGPDTIAIFKNEDDADAYAKWRNEGETE